MSHGRKPAVWILILLLAAASQAQAPRPADTPRFFPMAVWYGGGTARAPMLERGARVKEGYLAKRPPADQGAGVQYRAGLDRLGIGPARRRDLRFRDARRGCLSFAEEQQLKLVLRIYMDSAPPWVGEKYPDSLFVSSGGQAIRPESSPGYCRNDPGTAADVAFYAALAERAKRNPAFVGWDLWSEPHVINWAKPT